ncbi:Glucokinase [Lentibacillus sp. JNUCC-1]|nr:Glucokinase [Lentibacillus sp. JNUCC-1]
MIVDGANGTAGEIGHMTIDPNGYLCNCGRKGCLETIASATGITRQAMAYKTQQPTSALNHLFEEKGSLEAKDVFELAAQGDEPSQHILDYTMNTLGFALANAAILINPEKILIGGGVSKAGQVLIDGINQSFASYALPHVHDACQIKLAQLGNDAGIIGAAFLVRQKRYHVTFNKSENV